MYLAIDVSVLEKALVHCDRDRGRVCWQIWGFVSRLKWLHVCFDKGGKIETTYDEKLGNSTEYSEWWKKTIPRRYENKRPPHFEINDERLKQGELSHLMVILAIAYSAGDGKAVVDHPVPVGWPVDLKVDYVDPQSALKALKQSVVIYLRDSIQIKFSDDDLRNLCFELGSDYDELTGSTKTGKIISLIDEHRKTDTLNDLIDACEKFRPDIFR